MKSLPQKYKEAGKESMEALYWLESCCERLEDLLEYYSLQPEEEIFSVKNIERIFYLHELEFQLAEHQKKIKRLQYKKGCWKE